jgi:peptidyl-prolyl cis-trans isomerase D
MRKNMKMIMWIVVLAFVGTIFFVWGMDLGRRKEFEQKAAAAVVNGTAIPYETFSQAWDQRSRQLFEADKEPERQEVDRLRQELVDELIENTLLQQEFDRLGQKVFPEEVAARIMGISAFQQDGKFSQEKYLTLLRYNHISPDDFEAEQKQNLTILKMSQFLHDSVLVTDDQVKDYFQARGRQLKLMVASFSWKDFSKQVQIPESDIANYYQKNHAEYDAPEELRASHILITFKADAGEEAKLTAKLKIENLRNDIEKKGADFAELAKKYSEDPGSKDKGGDLGFFRKGMMVPAFEKMAFSLKPGQLSAPVETQFGYHLIKVTDRHEAKLSTLDDVRGKILDLLTEKESRKMTKEAAVKFAGVMKQTASLEQAAKKSGQKILTTSWIKEDGSVPGISHSETLVDKAFDLSLHVPSTSILAGDSINFVEVVAEQFPAFNEELFRLEKDNLTEKLKGQLGDQALRDWLTAARAKGKIINNIAKEADEAKKQEAVAVQPVEVKGSTLPAQAVKK